MKYLSFFLLALVFGCQPAQKEMNDPKVLKEEVFKIHDTVMPKMGELNRTAKKLTAHADSIKVTDSLRSVELVAAASEIKAANETMMDWMRNFDPDFDGTDEEIVKYMKEQKKAIQQVSDNMMESLKKGLTLLDEN